MIRELRDFLLRGNVLDLAIGIVIGAAFTGVVTAFTDGVLMPLIAALIGRPDFDSLAFVLNGTAIEYGRFITALVNFVIVATAIFFMVKGINSLYRKPAREPAETDHDLLMQIRDALRMQPRSTLGT